MKNFFDKIPDFFLIEITNRCNLKCPACPWHTCMTRELHDMSFEEYKQILPKIKPYAKAVCFYVMGEPLLNPDWNQIVAVSHDAGLRTIISTNGMLLESNMDRIFESGLDHLQVALDGFEAQTHGAYRRGADFDRIVDSLTLLAQQKKARQRLTPEVTIQTLATRQNENQIDSIKCFAEKLGFGFKLKKMHYGRTDDLKKKNKPLFMPQDPELVRIPGKSYYSEGESCPEMRQMVILSNGIVVPCCVDFDGAWQIGNIFKESVEDVWFGKEHLQFVDAYESHSNPFCESCDLC